MSRSLVTFWDMRFMRDGDGLVVLVEGEGLSFDDGVDRERGWDRVGEEDGERAVVEQVGELGLLLVRKVPKSGLTRLTDSG